MKRFQKLAISVALRAGRLLMQHYGKTHEIEHKGRHVINLVTNVDKKSEALVVNTLNRNFPTHQILAEEGLGAKGPSPYKWIVDPLDGTTNYTHGFPFFCVSIGLEVNGKMALGVVYAPMFQELFVGVRGKGASLNGKRIHVSEERDLSGSLLATGFPYDIREATRDNLNYFAKFAKTAQAIRRAGSAALDLCYLACGRFDGFWELRLAPWDLAAATLIVEESGGKVTNFEGKKLDLYGDDVVASNGKIHPAMLRVIQSVEKSQVL